MIFDARTLAQLRRTQEASMMHECTIEAYTVGEDGTISYGAPVTTVCGFKAENHAVNSGNDMYSLVEADAEMRLPLSVQIGIRDRVTLTKSFGAVQDPAKHFEVCSLPDSFGPSGHVVRLKEVYV